VLEYTNDVRFVLASLAVVMMAGFTGLSLTQGASTLGVVQRKLVVSMSAVALGGGIWSMHFVAMLGLRLPVQFYYDGLTTLISALVAILIVGLAFLILHFLPRSTKSITLAGAVVGLGIPAMHFIGMSGMELCQPVYSVGGVILSFVASLILSVAAVRIAYSERGRRNILLGTVVFGLTVFVVHFLAMGGTEFIAIATDSSAGPAIDNRALALIVTLATFVISGAFLLTGITFFPTARPARAEAPTPPQQAAPFVDPVTRPQTGGTIAIPYEREGRTYFIDSNAVAAIRAEGHYTILYEGRDQHFSPWSISDAQDRLTQANFIRVHRSYLVNPRHVTAFERGKDAGQCFIEQCPAIGAVPVSRTRLAELRKALGV
jgi:diguanylate cyclase